MDSRLLQPGRIVGSTDGTTWLVSFNMKTGSGQHFQLADLSGRTVSTPHNFDPISFRQARLANWMRKVGYNPDWDEYVKSYIRRAELPVDTTMNWAKYLQFKIVPRLDAPNTPDGMEMKDEAIHHIIITVLGQRRFLEKQVKSMIPSGVEGQADQETMVDNTTGFYNAVKEFPDDLKAKPLARQVTEVLMKMFAFRIAEANRYLKEVLQDQDVSRGVVEDSFVSITPNEDEEGGGRSILDTVSQGRSGMKDFEDAESDIDMGNYTGQEKDIVIGRFTNGFYQWLLKKYSEKGKRSVIRQYMRLLSLLHEETKSYGKMPKLDDIEEEWRNLQTTEEDGQLDHDGFKKLFVNLPILVERYVRAHFHGQESTLPAIIRILNRIGNEHRESKRQKENGEGKELLSSEDEALKGLPQESKLSAKQYESPRCNCGEVNNLQTCKTCGKHFCMLCMRDHHSNQPGHDKVAKAGE